MSLIIWAEGYWLEESLNNFGVGGGGTMVCFMISLNILSSEYYLA